MGLYFNNLAAGQPALAAGAARPLNAVERDLATVYELSIADGDAALRGDILLRIGKRLSERDAWTAAASAYRAAAILLKGGKSEYQQTVETAAELLTRAACHREAAALYQVLEWESRALAAPEPTVDEWRALAKHFEAKRAAARQAASLAGPQSLDTPGISIAHFNSLLATLDGELDSLRIGYVAIPCHLLFINGVLARDINNRSFALPSLGIRVFYGPDSKLEKLTPLDTPENEANGETISNHYKMTLPMTEFVGVDLTKGLQTILNIHQIPETPRVTVVVPEYSQLETDFNKKFFELLGLNLQHLLGINQSLKLSVSLQDSGVHEKGIQAHYKKDALGVSYKLIGDL